MSELKFKVIKGKKRVAIVAFLGVKILTNGLSDLKKLIYKYGKFKRKSSLQIKCKLRKTR